MRINTTTAQLQKQLLAPVMQQSIEMLLLPLAELSQSIDQELQNNPLLEIDEEKLQSQETLSKEDLLKALARSSENQSLPPLENTGDDETIEDRPVPTSACLEDELLQQLRVELHDPLDIKISELITGSLDEDGYLIATCEEIALLAGTDKIARIEYILRVVQSLEPAGIASRNLAECLLIQVRQKYKGRSGLMDRIITDHLEDLGHKRFEKIAKALDVSAEDVKQAARRIARLEPIPARNYRPIQSALYVNPDVAIVKDESNGYRVDSNREEIPPLRISSQYKNMLMRPDLDKEARTFIHEKLKSALAFIKSIKQRGRTLERIAATIIEKQSAFLEEGIRALVPMTLKDIAIAVDRNESTISRAVANKYIATPQGLFALKFFFSQGVADERNVPVASTSIKEEVKELIEGENKVFPLSDQEIQAHFRRKGVNIARRTVSKYRQSMRILPSHLRKD